MLHDLGTVAANFDFVIDECILNARTVFVLNSVVSGHKRGLDKYNTTYLLKLVELKTLTLTLGGHD